LPWKACSASASFCAASLRSVKSMALSFFRTCVGRR
jgi:hypothetical protein